MLRMLAPVGHLSRLIDLLSYEKEEIKASAAALLECFLRDSSEQKKMVPLGGITALLNLLKSTNDFILEPAVSCLCSCSMIRNMVLLF
jgi:hypothetical protein